MYNVMKKIMPNPPKSSKGGVRIAGNVIKKTSANTISAKKLPTKRI